MVRDDEMGRELTLSSTALADFCGLLGITVSDLAAVETVERLNHQFEVSSEKASGLDWPHVQRLVDHYADAVTVSIGIEGYEKLNVGPGVAEADVTRFVKSVSGELYSVTVRVDKDKLRQILARHTTRRHVQVFLFSETLRLALERGIARFESDIWPGAPAPLVVAILDTDVHLAGPLLSIFGGQSLPEVAGAAAVDPPAIDFAGIAESRQRHIGWEGNLSINLTPWHFQLDGSCEDEALRHLLLAQQVKLCALFTCDRARQPSTNQLLVEYRGRDHVSVLTIDETAPLTVTVDAASAMLNAVTWCYQRRGVGGQPDWVSDRLPFIQTRIAQYLGNCSERDRQAALVEAMPDLLRGIRWQWKAFIQGKVDEYLDREGQVETIVGDTVSAFADRTAELVKGLTETMLAAVAVLVGSFIAAAYTTPFNAALFRIGVLTYAGYVLVFPGLIGLAANIGSMRSAERECRQRTQRFAEILGRSKVTRILGRRVRDSKVSYYRWVVLVAAAYVAVAIASAVAAARVPDIVAIGGH